MDIRHQLIAEIKTILGELGAEDIEPSIEYTADLRFGDLTTNAAMIAAKKIGKNPMEVAGEMTAKLKKQKEKFKIEKVEAVRPGFINFWFSKDHLFTELDRLMQSGENLKIQKGNSIVVEYSSPNIAKPFTIGHLRSTIIGDAIANLLEAAGREVHRDNHIGDWGTQFGKQIYAIKTWGNEEELEKEEKPVKKLFELYVKFHEEAKMHSEIEDEAREWFKKLENGNQEARRLWQKCIDWSMKEFKKIYEELGINFTENEGKGFGESFFEDKMGDVINELEEKHLLKDSEGAKLVFLDDKKLPPLMIVKKDGATLYSTRDLAADKFRIERYGKDIVIVNEVGSEQGLYFKQLYAVEELLGWFGEEQRVHIRHGMYRFKDRKMSTRQGNVIWLEEILEEAFVRAKKLAQDEGAGSEEIARQVAVGALKWNDLKRNPEQDIVFDWDDVLNMQGDSGPYLQYAFVRTKSVLEKSKINPPAGGQKSIILNVNFELKTEELNLLRLLIRFDEVVLRAAGKYAPNILCNYLFELAQTFNLFYQKLPILKEAEEIMDFRLALTAATGEVIKEGLRLLGIEAPEKM